MDFNQLVAFIAAAEQQSFSKAAEQLHLSQSAISKRIALLESNLDVVLFERYGQRVQLSEAGKTLLPDARDIINKAHAMKQHSEMSKTSITGKLRIATSHHIGLYRLPNILKKFTQHYPDVQLNMHFTDSEIAYDEINQGLFDLAIATLPKKPSSTVTTIPLWQDELLVMLSQNHPLSHKDKLTLQDLADFPAILPDKDTFTRQIIDRFFNQNNCTYQLAFTTNYLETIKVMVEAGLGWSILPDIMKTSVLATYPLPGNSLLQRQLGLILHPGKTLTPTLTTLIAALKAQAPLSHL